MQPQEIPHWVIEEIVDISRQRLYHWRREGLIRRRVKAKKTRIAYSFNDLVAIKIIKKLRDNGVSLREIKEVDKRLGEEYPGIENPITAKTILAYGKRAVLVHKQKPFEALSGQFLLFDTRQIESEMKKAYRELSSSADRIQGRIRHNFGRKSAQREKRA